MQIIDRQKVNHEIECLREKYGQDRSALIPILQELQEIYGYLPYIVMQETAHSLGIHPSEVEGVASFYSFLRTKEKQGKYVIRLCQTISCNLAKKVNVARQFENELGIKFGQTTNDGMFTLEYTNCLGMCDQGPALMINDRLFSKVTPEKASAIIADCRRDFLKSEFPKVVPSDVQKSGPILNHGLQPSESLKTALTMSRSAIISIIRESNLKGRGGAGFPTSIKWQLAGAAIDDKKYVVCNADEGEPGTFKDRYLLYDHIEIMLDGMAIAAYAIGAQKGFIYLRGEYKYMKKYLEEKIENRRKTNLLGKDILGKDKFNFDIEIRMGAGAYVCGEETALIESLEGYRGEPRNRPPFPVDTGFQKHPTIVNNVETFIDAAIIISKGAKWFLEHGTARSSGTKIFSVSGNCERPGIYELPFGIMISQLLKEVGGENAKAVQVGGASGKCLARKDFNRSIAFEDIASGGSIIVFGPDTDMLAVAKNFMEFFVEESCGQCTPCREGNVKLLDGIEKLEKGICSVTYLNELMKLDETIQLASKCGLGQSSPNAFLSIMENFKSEILGRVPEIN
ncbi:MAG: NADH-quinone oxidoreductase subunit NuoE [Candidatus Marinimicrobia bacterium CG08_land_8_20_14_0_20_45_22]|nr:MAG: NADH-quinone oxidoreductase subunit NuoE [Candidatus Marinimicrobia bacterium CG08_land_8_20_14_0_20_45_22]